jgi:ElaB/YqjD/DUF883 family membrane-anchored ribosome-binding protein
MQTKPLITEPASNGQSAASSPENAGADSAPSGIAQEFQDFVADMEDLIKSSTSLTGDDLNRAKASLKARVAAARAYVEELPGAISAQVRNSAQVADGYVRDQPWRAIGVTAAVGVLIGFLLGRRGR